MEQQYKSLKAQLELLIEKNKEQVKFLSEARTEEDVAKKRKDMYEEEMRTALRDKQYLEERKEQLRKDIDTQLDHVANLQNNKASIENDMQDLQREKEYIEREIQIKNKKLQEIMHSVESYGKIELKQKEVEASYMDIQRKYGELQIKISKETEVLDYKFQELKEKKKGLLAFEQSLYEQKKSIERREIRLKEFAMKLEGKKKVKRKTN